MEANIAASLKQLLTGLSGTVEYIQAAAADASKDMSPDQAKALAAQIKELSQKSKEANERLSEVAKKL